MIEAWASSHVGTSISTTGSFTPSNTRRIDPYKLNLLARELFGKFVPDIKYPSLSDTASRIARENNQTAGLQSLSSGEQQIVSMLYAASPALTKAGSIVLIDEPEISLHIDWQRILLRKMQQQLGERQIIVCTHSPEIGGDHLEAFQEIELISSS